MNLGEVKDSRCILYIIYICGRCDYCGCYSVGPRCFHSFGIVDVFSVLSSDRWVAACHEI